MVAPCCFVCDARGMEDEERRDEIPDAQLDEWFRLHNGRGNGALAGLSGQARDKAIRRLIEEIRSAG